MPKQKSNHKMINFRNADMFGQQFVQHQESWNTAHLSVDLVLLLVVSYRAYIKTCTTKNTATTFGKPLNK